jgi:hypothetical protein
VFFSYRPFARLSPEHPDRQRRIRIDLPQGCGDRCALHDKFSGHGFTRGTGAYIYRNLSRFYYYRNSPRARCADWSNASNRNGFFGRVFLTVLPIILAKMVFSGVSAYLYSSSPCIAFLAFVGLLPLAIFKLLLIAAVTLHGKSGLAAYKSCWRLIKKEWRNIFSEYITSVTIMTALACPIYFSILLFFRTQVIEVPIVGAVFADLLYLWVMIEMTLLFNSLVRSKISDSLGVSKEE